MQFIKIAKELWDEKVNEEKNSNIFHTSWWSDVSARIFNKSISYYLFINQENQYLIPIFFDNEIKESYSIGLIGNGGILPIGHMSITYSELIKTIASKFSFFFGSLPTKIMLNIQNNPVVPKSYYYNPKIFKTQVLDITSDIEQVFNFRISGNVRTAVRKAKKKDIYIIKEDFNDYEILDAYNLLIKTQTYVGSNYTTPFELFENLISTTFSSLYIAKKDDVIVSMTVCLFFKSSAFFYLNGWDREYSPLCANQLLIWEMILDAKNKDCQTFNFGSSHYDSLTKAKSKWGTSDYYTINLERNI